MLVITRKLGEAVYIGEGIRVIIVAIKGKQIRLGIEAPRDVSVVREEIKNVDTEEHRSVYKGSDGTAKPRGKA